MTVNEMHIAVNLGVQKIASFQADTLLPQEIDFELNLAMMRFIKQRYNPTSNRLGKGFEQSQKRIDDLRTLVQENIGTTYNPQNLLTDGLGSYMYTLNNTNIYTDRYTLPLDYLFLVSVKAVVQYTCNMSILPYVSTATQTLQYAPVSLTPPGPGYQLIWISVINSPYGTEISRDVYTNSGNYLYGMYPSQNVPSPEQINSTTAQSTVIDSNHFYIVNPMTSYAFPPSSGVTIAWSLNGAVTYTYSGTTITVSNLPNRQATNSISGVTPDTRISLCKFAQHDDIISIMKDPFNKTAYDLISYTVQENYIDVYTDNTFVVPQLAVTYIRKPKTITINDGTGNAIGCELPEHTHPEIVEMAIKSILEGIESQRYQSQSMENLESE